MMSATLLGTSLFMGAGGTARWCESSASTSSVANGSLPLDTSYRMIPSEYKSLRASVALPAHCSGDI